MKTQVQIQLTFSREELIDLSEVLEAIIDFSEYTPHPLSSLYSKMEAALVREAKSASTTTTNQSNPSSRPSRPWPKGVQQPS